MNHGSVLDSFQQCNKKKGASSHHLPNNHVHVVHLAQRISEVVLLTSTLLRVVCWPDLAAERGICAATLGANHHLAYISDVLLGLFCGLEICSVISGWHRDALGTGQGGKGKR